MSVCCPFLLVTSQAWLRSDVLEPQPGVTTGESRKFLALGVLDRFPAVPSAVSSGPFRFPPYARLYVMAPLVRKLG